MRLRNIVPALVAGVLAVGGVITGALPAAAVTYLPGDVFVGTQGGLIEHRTSSGTLIETLNTTLGNGFDTGMCFDKVGNLYATDFNPYITKFDPNGNVAAAKFVDTSSDPLTTESCIWDAANANMYVGGPFVNQIRQYDLTGTEIARNTVASPDGTRGTDWVDLSSDQCTVYYTNEGGTIRRFNACIKTQEPDFASLNARCFALRIRPTTMEVMVACDDGAHLLSSTGATEKTYPGSFFALNLDPDGKSFWTAAPGGSTVYKYDIASGSLLLSFGTNNPTWGLAVFGEITAGGGGGGGCTSDQAISANGTSINATEGAPFSGQVATFTDPDKASLATDYTATIDWGDGTATSAGTITGTMGMFTVNGDHTYAEEGSYKVAVTISDTDCAANTATAHSTASVADAALHAQCASPPVSTQSFNGPTATFIDDNAGATSADFSATINWGDGSSSAGTITGGPGPGPYTVTGSHTYAKTGSFTITTAIADDGGATATATCTVLVGAFPTANGGTFVVGDLEATGPGAGLTWWSSQWAQINQMTGGPAPSSMKGFAGFEDMPLPAGVPLQKLCGMTWTTDTGNATPPPQSVPDDMFVIVSSHIVQNGSVVSGDIKEIILVHNNPGYAPDPGHPGTGTEVVLVCKSV